MQRCRFLAVPQKAAVFDILMPTLPAFLSLNHAAIPLDCSHCSVICISLLCELMCDWTADAFTVLHGAGYEYLADPADANSPNKKLIAAWKDASPEGQNLRTVRFAGELNAEVETVGLKKIETEKQKAPTEDSRKLMVLRWKALKNADTALSLAFKPKDPVDQPGEAFLTAVLRWGGRAALREHHEREASSCSLRPSSLDHHD